VKKERKKERRGREGDDKTSKGEFDDLISWESGKNE
jgi:hypothetical protein